MYIYIYILLLLLLLLLLIIIIIITKMIITITIFIPSMYLSLSLRLSLSLLLDSSAEAIAMHSLYFMRHVLNSSDIKYAGKLVFKLTCFGNLSPLFLLSWDVGRDTYLPESRMKVVFPCRRGRPVSKTRGRPNRPALVGCHTF